MIPAKFYPRRSLDGALKNREPAASGAFVSVADAELHIASGSALDFSGYRKTAVPAGHRGRITVSGNELHEAGVSVRFFVATIQPEIAFTPIPYDRATIDAGVKYLARQGFNAIRLMGLEHWFKYGLRGVDNFDVARVDAFDYFLYACKREGVFWIPCTQSYNGFEDIADPTKPFTYTEATSVKARLYTEADVRARWKTGFAAIYNRVNPYTGINILQDPALVVLEPFNEQTTTFCGGTQFPSRWLTRTSGATAAAKTWGEWLQDPTQAHGYADLAALNTSWGTAFASYALAAADAMPALSNSMGNTQKNIDVIRYVQYLEDDLGAFYASCVAEWGYPGIVAWNTMYAANCEARNMAKVGSVNHIANLHNYYNIARAGLQATTDPDNPVWEALRVTTALPLPCAGKPVWVGEAGNHTYARWRHQFPIMVAALAAQGAVASAWFNQGDFFAPNYYNDTTLHGDRLRRLDTFCAPGAFVNDFVRVLQCALLLRGDVAVMSSEQALILNDRYYGVNPRTPSRVDRYYSTLYSPVLGLGVMTRARLHWTADTSDDSLAVTWNTKSWYTILADLQTAGAIAADHPSLVSAAANNGSIVSVATTGSVGGLTATQAEPVLDIGSNTLVDGDLVQIPSMTGSVGTWPGTNSRGARAAVLKGTGNYVQLKADATRNVPGFPLTGLSGANFSAGTWCELDNVLESGNRQWGMSRRLKYAFVNTARTIFFAHTNATLPVTLGALVVTALTQHASLFVLSLDGLDITASARLLIGICGEAINTGMTYTVGADGKQTLTAEGNYPVQQLDVTAGLSLAVTGPMQAWSLYRLRRNGQRECRESLASVDAGASTLLLSLRTGSVYPSVLFELTKP